MHFGAPFYLYAIALIPILFFLFRRGGKRRQKLLDRFGESRLVRHLVQGVDERKRARKERIFLVALALVLFSLSHPQYGEKQTPVRREGIDMIFAFDTSLSMLAKDITPNRMERARMEVEGLLSRLDGDRVGIVSFAGTAVPTSPLTIDYGAMRMFLRGVDPWTVPTAGTAIAEAIRKSTRMLVEGGTGSRAIILLTDGEDHEGDVEKAAEEAAKEGIRIFTIGFGTVEGELIPVSRQEYKKDKKGEFVVSHRDDTPLREIAAKTGGRHFVIAEQPDALDQVLDDLSGMSRREYTARLAVIREERFTWFLLPATILLVIESLMTVTPRRREEYWSGRIE